MQNLNIRYPFLYTTSTCSRCLTTEDTIHLILCSNNNTNIKQSLINITQQTITFLKISNTSALTLLNIILNSTLNSPNLQYQPIIYSIIGIFSTPIYNNIKALLHKQTDFFFINFSNNLLKWYYQDLWFERNIHQHHWEQLRNITPKTKRTKFSLPTIRTISNNNITNTQQTNITPYIEKWFLQGSSLTNCLNPMP